MVAKTSKTKTENDAIYS